VVFLKTPLTDRRSKKKMAIEKDVVLLPYPMEEYELELRLIEIEELHTKRFRGGPGAGALDAVLLRYGRELSEKMATERLHAKVGRRLAFFSEKIPHGRRS
jgi:hypothetical protein